MGVRGRGRPRKVEVFRPAEEDKPKRQKPKDYPEAAAKKLKTSSGCRFGE